MGPLDPDTPDSQKSKTPTPHPLDPYTLYLPQPQDNPDLLHPILLGFLHPMHLSESPKPHTNLQTLDPIPLPRHTHTPKTSNTPTPLDLKDTTHSLQSFVHRFGYYSMDRTT